MLDTQIYDLIVTIPDMAKQLNHLSKEGKVTILCTHIQEDELAQIPDVQKRNNIAQIIKKKVATSGAVWDVSKWDQATWGNGSSSGVGINDVRSPSRKHTSDALIASTAARDADVLVTEDNRLTNRMKNMSARCQIWGFDQFKSYIFSHHNNKQ